MIATSSLPCGVGDDATGDDDVEDGLLELRGLRERDPLVFSSTVAGDEREAHRTDRAAERQAGDLGRHRRRVDGESVVELVGSDAQDGDDDLDLVAEAVDERRAQRAGRSDGRRGSPRSRGDPHDGRTSRGSCRRRTSALRRRPSAGRSRSCPSGACWRSSRSAAWSPRRGRRRLRPVPAGRDGRLRSGPCGCRTSVVENGFGEFDFWTFQEVFLLCFTSSPRVGGDSYIGAGEQADRHACLACTCGIPGRRLSTPRLGAASGHQ